MKRYGRHSCLKRGRCEEVSGQRFEPPNNTYVLSDPALPKFGILGYFKALRYLTVGWVGSRLLACFTNVGFK